MSAVNSLLKVQYSLLNINFKILLKVDISITKLELLRVTPFYQPAI